MTLFETLVELEENDDLHLGRLLILISSFEKKDSTTEIEGLTKLAKLDFLLRYPLMLERALNARGIDSRKISIEEHEKDSVESKMVRFKYGPWDFRYRRLLNILVARNLCEIRYEGRTVKIQMTSSGLAMAKKIKNMPEYNDITNRAIVLKKHFNKSGSWLKDFIYSTFPEISSLRYGEEIEK